MSQTFLGVLRRAPLDARIVLRNEIDAIQVVCRRTDSTTPTGEERNGASSVEKEIGSRYPLYRDRGPS